VSTWHNTHGVWTVVHHHRYLTMIHTHAGNWWPWVWMTLMRMSTSSLGASCVITSAPHMTHRVDGMHHVHMINVCSNE